LNLYLGFHWTDLPKNSYISLSPESLKAVKVLLLLGNLLEEQCTLLAVSWHTLEGFYQQIIPHPQHAYCTQGASWAAIGQ
jgi:hypothetical protein